MLFWKARLRARKLARESKGATLRSKMCMEVDMLSRPLIRRTTKSGKAKWIAVRSSSRRPWASQLTRLTSAKLANTRQSPSSLLSAHMWRASAQILNVWETSSPSPTFLSVPPQTRTRWWLLCKRTRELSTLLWAVRDLDRAHSSRRLRRKILETRCAQLTLKWDRFSQKTTTIVFQVSIKIPQVL